MTRLAIKPDFVCALAVARNSTVSKFVLQAVPEDPRLRRLAEIDYSRCQDAINAEVGVPPDDELTPTGSGPLPVVDLDRPPSSPMWLVEDFLARDSLLLVGGPPGQGKTWVAMTLALALADRSPFLGHVVPDLQRVMYLDFENGESELHRRFNALGYGPAHRSRLQVISMHDKITNQASLEALMDQVDAFEPDLVIVDTLASAASLDENDARSVEEFYDLVWKPLRKRGTSLALLHHTRKRTHGEARIDRFRGSTHLIGRVDRALIVDGATSAKKRLSDVKARQHASGADIEFGLVQVSLPGGLRLQVATSVQGASGKAVSTPGQPKDRKKEIVQLVMGGTTTARDMAAALTMTTAGVNKHLRLMVADGTLAKMGHKYTVTPGVSPTTVVTP